MTEQEREKLFKVGDRVYSRVGRNYQGTVKGYSQNRFVVVQWDKTGSRVAHLERDVTLAPKDDEFIDAIEWLILEHLEGCTCAPDQCPDCTAAFARACYRAGVKKGAADAT